VYIPVGHPYMGVKVQIFPAVTGCRRDPTGVLRRVAGRGVSSFVGEWPAAQVEDAVRGKLRAKRMDCVSLWHVDSAGGRSVSVGDCGGSRADAAPGPLPRCEAVFGAPGVGEVVGLGFWP